MGFLSSIGSFLSGLNPFDDEDKKKKQQQQQAAAPQKAPQPGLVVQPQRQDNTQVAVNPVPDNGINLTVPLQKPAKTPAQQRAQATIDKMGGPVDPNYVSKKPGIGADVAEAVKGALDVNRNINHSAPLVKATNFIAGSAVADPNSTLSAPKPAKSLVEAGTNLIGNTDPQIGELMNPGVKLVKAVPGKLADAKAAAQGALDLLKRPSEPSIATPGKVEPPLPGEQNAPSAPARTTPQSASPNSLNTSSPGNVPQNAHVGNPAPVQEVPGVNSTNPNRDLDAAGHIVDEAARTASNTVAPPNLDTPAYQRQGLPEPQPQSALDVPTFQRNNADELVKTATDRVANVDQIAASQRAADFARRQAIADAYAVSPQKGEAMAALRKPGDPAAVADNLAALRETNLGDLNTARGIQAARDELLQKPSSEPVPGTPAAVIQDGAPVNPLVNEAPAVPPAPPVDTAVPAPDAAPAPADVPPVPADPAAPGGTPPEMPQPSAQPATAPAAPVTHDALVKQLGPAASSLKGKFSDREIVNLDDLKQKAAGVVANMTDENLLKAFSTEGPDTLVHDANSFAVARAALERLSQHADDPTAVQTVSNIMDAMDRFVSKSGQGLRVAQEEFDSMPLPMKVRYIVKKIDAANRNTNGYELLADDPAKAAVVEANIAGHLQGSQAIAEQVAAVEGRLNAIADAVKTGGARPEDPRPLAAELKTLQQKLEANNGELAKYYAGLVPGRTLGQKALVDFPRRMMLASFTGRVNDLVTTGLNVVNLGAQNLVQGVVAKTLNKFRPGMVTDTTRGVTNLVKGGATELRKTAGEIGGKQYAGDLQKALRGGTDARSGLTKPQGVVGRTIQAATEMATNASAGVRDQRLYQLAAQEGEKAGLTGKALSDYSEARAAVPDRAMLAQAERLHQEVNNLNDNPITRGLGRISAAISGDSAVGGLIKNQIMPFTSWLGGNIWNSLTDKNVVASFAKVIGSAAKGDTEGIVRNVAKLTNNAAQTYALGYLLTKSGLITNQNAEGYNDAGAYLHIGDRYIPVGFLGFAAPNIILGNATYQAFNGDNSDGKGVSEKILDTAGGALGNLAKSINVTGALGSDTNLSRTVDAAQAPGADAGDAAAVAAGGVAGQFVPAITGDINAGINNSPLNPTHEAANTKVVDPNSPSGQKKDVAKSAIASFENRIPGLSQQLPRKQDVAAQDLLDRTTKGDRGTPGGEATQAAAKSVADRTKDFKARSVPDPKGKNFDDAVQARIEDGDYDKAVEGLKAKLDDNQKDTNIPKSKNKEIQDQIKTLEVTKNGKYDPSVIDTYKKTSLAEWRDMGDPESDNYDEKTYQLLYKYDQSLADSGVSRNTTKQTDPLYSAKKPAKGRSGGKNTTVTGNTIGNTPTLGKVSLGDLAPQKAGSVKMPTIQQVKAGDLIKARKITVSKA